MERETYLAKTKQNPKDNQKAQLDTVYKIFPGHASLSGASAGPVGPGGPIGLYPVPHLL